MAPQHLILTAPSNPKKPCSCFIILLGITTYLMGLKREKKERQTTPSVKKNSFFFLVDFEKNFLLTQAVQIGPKFTKKGTFS